MKRLKIFVHQFDEAIYPDLVGKIDFEKSEIKNGCLQIVYENEIKVFFPLTSIYSFEYTCSLHKLPLK